ncbi:MAG TPA: hypothetical protein VG713_20690 [Pirellulales bacterium]|nr:hypothetical protein [Pirellulales bacterium]
MKPTTLMAHLVLYTLVITAIVVALMVARSRVLDRYAATSAQSWEQWKADTQSPDPRSPVARRPVTAPEPPLLVLSRDYFGVVLTTCLAIGTFLFAFMAATLRGALHSAPPSGRSARHRSNQGIVT